MKKVLKICKKAYNISFFVLKRQLKMHISKFLKKKKKKKQRKKKKKKNKKIKNEQKGIDNYSKSLYNG